MLVGPGGAGKGTVAAALTAADPQLWLSRSWTTRPPRPGEAEGDYVFVTHQAFMDRVSTGGFLEWAEFLGHLYGTPQPEPPAGCDVLLEIDVQGAEQVVAKRPDAVVVLLLPPSDAVQRARLTARGDAPEQVDRRVATGHDEVARARRLATHEVVNHQVGQAVAELAGIVARTRGKDPDGA